MVTPKQTRSSVLRQQKAQQEVGKRRSRQTPLKLKDYTSSLKCNASVNRGTGIKTTKKVSSVSRGAGIDKDSTTSHPDLCHLCQVNCTSECIQCDSCKKWYHNSCILIDERDNTLFDLCKINFNCVFCITSSCHSLTALKEIEQAVQKCISYLSSDKSVPCQEVAEASSGYDQPASHSSCSDLQPVSILRQSESDSNNCSPSDTLFTLEVVEKTVVETHQDPDLFASTPIPGGPSPPSFINDYQQTINVAQETPIISASDSSQLSSIHEIHGQLLRNDSNGVSGVDSGQTPAPISGSSGGTEGQSNLQCAGQILVITIDNLHQAWKFKKSHTIKSEFNKFFPNVKIDLAYSLRGGGIALHFNSEEDLLQVLNFQWPTTAFGSRGVDLIVRRVDSNPRLVLKNINPNLSVQEIASLLSQFTGGTVVQAHRFKHRDSNKPIPVVKISCTPHAANLIKTHSLAFYGETVVVEDFYKNHQPDISCFRCQERGHTAPWCPIH